MNIRVVELVGAPGSGKSTLAGWLAGRQVGGRVVVPADQLLLVPRRGAGPLGPLLTSRPVRSRLARSGRLRAALLRPAVDVERPVAAWEPVLSMLPGHVPLGPRADAAYREVALAWLTTTAVLIEASGRVGPEVLPLLEEGVVQRALSVLGADPARGPLDAMLGRRPEGTLLVHLVVPDEVLVGRALGRVREGRAPVLHRDLDERSIATLVREDATALARLVARCVDLGTPVVTLADDGTEDVGRRGAQVLDAVRERLSAG